MKIVRVSTVVEHLLQGQAGGYQAATVLADGASIDALVGHLTALTYVVCEVDTSSRQLWVQYCKTSFVVSDHSRTSFTTTKNLLSTIHYNVIT